MIQRIQTGFLLLGTVASGFVALSLSGMREHFAFATASVLNLTIIFLYRKRKWQIGLTAGLLLPLYALGILLMWKSEEAHHYQDKEQILTLGIAIGVAILSGVAAMGAIRKDERLVKESDRLR